MNWSKLDPDHVIYALTFLSSVAGWLWKKAHGEKQATFKETVNAVIDSIVLEMFGELDDSDVLRVNIQGYLASTRARVEKHGWDVLSKRGVPRNAATERLFHAAIERASAMVARDLVDRRNAAAARK